jgi:hypothetical protein
MVGDPTLAGPSWEFNGQQQVTGIIHSNQMQIPLGMKMMNMPLAISFIWFTCKQAPRDKLHLYYSSAAIAHLVHNALLTRGTGSKNA